MKKNIRKGVFETNSSSTHSFSYNEDYKCKKLEIESFDINDGKIHGYFYELGWGCEDYNGGGQILGIVLTHIASKDYDMDIKSCYSDEHTKKEIEEIEKHNIRELEKNKFFILFKEAIKELTGAELIINNESFESQCYPFGYVDHQSNDTLDEIFEGSDEEVKEKMKNALITGCYETDNDNH